MKKFLNKILIHYSISGLIFTLPLATYAAADQDSISNPLGSGTTTLTAFLTMVLGAATQIGAIVVVVAIIYCGFLFVVAQGNEEKLSKAKTALTWTLIGAAILLGATALQLAISNTVGNLGLTSSS